MNDKSIEKNNDTDDKVVNPQDGDERKNELSGLDEMYIDGEWVGMSDDENTEAVITFADKDDDADKVGRGLTSSVIHSDELPFSNKNYDSSVKNESVTKVIEKEVTSEKITEESDVEVIYPAVITAIREYADTMKGNQPYSIDEIAVKQNALYANLMFILRNDNPVEAVDLFRMLLTVVRENLDGAFHPSLVYRGPRSKKIMKKDKWQEFEATIQLITTIADDTRSNAAYISWIQANSFYSPAYAERVINVMRTAIGDIND